MDREVVKVGSGDNKPDGKDGPKFTVDIEGTLHPWHQDTITTEQIIELGKWDPSQGAIMIDKDNNETPLRPGQVIELKPGQGFSKKIHFKRGR